MEEQIRSIHNDQVKLWSSLQTRKGRERSGAYLVEGAHLVAEALRSGAAAEAVLYVPGTAAVKELELLGFVPEHNTTGPRWISVSEAVMDKITEAQTPQGVAAVMKLPAPDLGKLLTYRLGVFVAVDAVQDPGNLGTIVRSADAVGATAVLLGKGTVDMYNPKTVRSTMGSLFHIPIVSCDLAEAFPRMKECGIKIAATSLAANNTCFEADFTGPTCFLLGNEGAGVSAELLALADETIIIPIPGRAESLNVAMAATVLLYETVRQRGYRSSASVT
ncbi:TrmH family RNA methyltransferase [Paenibacillus thermotolerans]|uniref:TrmH family RNA methyltransferase n=1 Tax=Paenibacillus thermotolerans TaxID=3027807 RepID=UPI0023687906|nr:MULTISPECIES: RNA methyltransferase [unclassified Paenibacillus]